MNYKVIVSMQEWSTLIDTDKIKNAIRGKLKGEVYTSTVQIAESRGGGDTGLPAHLIKRFYLSNPEDFESFAKAMKTIEGVLETEKAGEW